MDGLAPPASAAAADSSSSEPQEARREARDAMREPKAKVPAASSPYEQNWLTMRFKVPQTELAFTKSRNDAMNRNTLIICIIFLVSLVPYFIEVLTMEEHPQCVSRVRCTVEVISEISVAVALIVMVRCRRDHTHFGCCRRFLSFFAMEVLFCFFMLQLLFIRLNQPLLWKRLSGAALDAEELQSVPYLISRIALVLDGIVTVTHLMLPIRYHIMVWADLVYASSFASFAIALGGISSPDVTMHVVVFSALVVGASAGLRSNEKKERQLFSVIADERQLRAQAEFQSEMLQNDLSFKPSVKDRDPCRRQASPGEASEDGRSNAAGTTATGELFKDVGRNLVDTRSWETQAFQTWAELQNLGLKEQWLIGEDELVIKKDKVLGVGACGMVLSGSYCSGPVAVKITSSASKWDQSSLGFATLNELRILRKVRHPHIALFHGACLGSSLDKVMLVMEMVHGVPLDVFVMKLQAWRRNSPHAFQQVQLILGVAESLIYLHSRKPVILHGDLKPANILVERRASGPFPKLLDFGLSRLVTQNAKKAGGTLKYMAPEIVPNGDVPRKPSADMDVFSLGRLMFCIASGRRPLAQHTNDTVIKSMRRGANLELAWFPGTRLLTALRPTMELCMALKPKDRPKVQEVHDMTSACQVTLKLGSGDTMATSFTSLTESNEDRPAQERRGDTPPERYSLGL